MEFVSVMDITAPDLDVTVSMCEQVSIPQLMLDPEQLQAVDGRWFDSIMAVDMTVNDSVAEMNESVLDKAGGLPVDKSIQDRDDRLDGHWFDSGRPDECNQDHMSKADQRRSIVDKADRTNSSTDKADGTNCGLDKPDRGRSRHWFDSISTDMTSVTCTKSIADKLTKTIHDLDGKVSACEEKWLADHGCYEREQKELNDLSSECKRVTEALTTIRQQNEQLRENLMQTCQLVDQLATDQRAMQEQLDHDRYEVEMLRDVTGVVWNHAPPILSGYVMTSAPRPRPETFLLDTRAQPIEYIGAHIWQLISRIHYQNWHCLPPPPQTS